MWDLPRGMRTGCGWLCGASIGPWRKNSFMRHLQLQGTSMAPWDAYSAMEHGWLRGTCTAPWDSHSSKGHGWLHGTSIGPWDMDGSMGHAWLLGKSVGPWDMPGSTGHTQHSWEGTVGTGEHSLAQDPNRSKSGGAVGPLEGPLLLARTPSPAGVPLSGRSPLPGERGPLSVHGQWEGEPLVPLPCPCPLCPVPCPCPSPLPASSSPCP